MSQRLIRLSVTNFKKIRAAEIIRSGNVTKISGENRAGKSSLLDGMACVFLGQRYHPENPVRNGEKKATVVGETETLIVTREWTDKGRHTLKVDRKDGADLDGTPQDELDRVYAAVKIDGKRVVFDPADFAMLPAKEQVALLRQLTGLDTTALDLKRKQLYERRTAVNAEHKALEAQSAGVKLPPEPAQVPVEKDLAAIAEQKVEAERVRNDNAMARQHLEHLKADRAKAAQQVEMLRAELARWEDRLASLGVAVEDQEKLNAELVDPDTSTIDKEISAAKLHNANVRQLQNEWEQFKAKKQQAERLRKLASAKKDAADDYTRQIEEIDAEKARMLAEAKMPLPGLTIEEDRIFLNGAPFDQASDAEKILMGLNIYVGLKPELRLARIKNGSLLSKKSMAALAEWTEANDFDVWVELVEDDGADCIVIEDGEIVGHEEADDDSELAAAVPGTDDSRASG